MWVGQVSFPFLLKGQCRIAGLLPFSFTARQQLGRVLCPTSLPDPWNGKVLLGGRVGLSGALISPISMQASALCLFPADSLLTLPLPYSMTKCRAASFDLFLYLFMIIYD